MKQKCCECDSVVDVSGVYKGNPYCPQCYDEVKFGILKPACFNVCQNPCGDGWGDDFSFDRAVKQYESQ